MGAGSLRCKGDEAASAWPADAGRWAWGQPCGGVGRTTTTHLPQRLCALVSAFVKLDEQFLLFGGRVNGHRIEDGEIAVRLRCRSARRRLRNELAGPYPVPPLCLSPLLVLSRPSLPFVIFLSLVPHCSTPLLQGLLGPGQRLRAVYTTYCGSSVVCLTGLIHALASSRLTLGALGTVISSAACTAQSQGG